MTALDDELRIVESELYRAMIARDDSLLRKLLADDSASWLRTVKSTSISKKLAESDYFVAQREGGDTNTGLAFKALLQRSLADFQSVVSRMPS
jgi:hypothetical protein